MCAEASAAFADESGGMLIGYRASGGRELVIVDVIGPGPGAEHRPRSFIPDGPWQRHRLSEIFTETEGAHTYLGDWHSHPGGGSSPSALDNKTAARISRRRSARTPRPLTLIAYGGDPEWELAAYCWDGAELVPAPHKFFGSAG
jgi:integrative and conjugative element protein (TIGR02256 family)